jgi:GLPGLI family protein
MKKQFLFVVCICLTILSHAQQVVFLDKVSIDYVKTVAVWPFMKEIEPEWFDRQKDQMPKETLTYYNFTGDRTKSVFRQTKEAEVPKGKWAPTYADNNVIYNDYSTSSTVSQKPCFEETFLVKDSFFNVKWKLTADTRVIAGFECRKAVGILFDTVSVFAFYTDEIMINGGPESITGLPGMILGVGIPRLHATWFATSVKVLDAIDPKKIAPATKGKTTTRSGMLTLLDKALSQSGEWGQKLALIFML